MRMARRDRQSDAVRVCRVIHLVVPAIVAVGFIVVVGVAGDEAEGEDDGADGDHVGAAAVVAAAVGGAAAAAAAPAVSLVGGGRVLVSSTGRECVHHQLGDIWGFKTS